jgi:hypothetical protein
MKKLHFALIFCILVAVIFISSCKKDENNNLVQDNGLTKDINDFIPPHILKILDSLGMPINRGGNPAVIEGNYDVSPNVLIASNRENDVIGGQYSDVLLTFSDQNNEKLTLLTQYSQANQESKGYSSFIVGDNDKFTVFARIKTHDPFYNDSALSTQIYSGTIKADHIENLHIALVMLDDYGDNNNHYIEIGDARVFHDSDSISEKNSSLKSYQINRLREAFSDNISASVLGD